MTRTHRPVARAVTVALAGLFAVACARTGASGTPPPPQQQPSPPRAAPTPPPAEAGPTIPAALLDRLAGAGSFDGEAFDPVRLVEGVNALQPLGTGGALSALRELAARSRAQSRYPEAVALLLRAGFTCDRPWPPLRVGEPVGHPRDDASPLHPLAIEADLPLLLVSGYELAGLPEDPSAMLEFATAHCRLRPAPLRPPDHPLPSVDALVAGDRWLQGSGHAADRARLRAQALRTVASLLPPTATPPRSGQLADDAAWKRAEREVAALRPAWNADTGRYQSALSTSGPPAGAPRSPPTTRPGGPR